MKIITEGDPMKKMYDKKILRTVRKYADKNLQNSKYHSNNK